MIRRGLLAASLLVGFVTAAVAGPKDDILQKSKEAMEAYDSMDYSGAKKQLNQALAAAKKAKLDRDPVAAKVYLYLGIAVFADGDTDGAKVAFLSAVQIDGKIQIDAAYKSPELNKLLDEARKEAAGAGGAEPDPIGGGGADCGSIKGLQHTPILSGKAGVDEKITVQLGEDVTATRVVVGYRIEGTEEWLESKLSKQGDCEYVGKIPGSAKKGSLIHYFVAAYGDGPKPLASKGSQGAPEIMELTAATGGGDGEDPIGGGGGGEKSGGDVAGGVIAGGKPPKVYIAVAGGTGFGYVTGKTEFGNEVETCCIGNSLVVITPELGFYASRKTSIGIAGRIGLPIGANVMGHSTVAPGAMIRLRHAFGATGEGVRVMAQLGGGFLRNTIKLQDNAPGMDTDIVAQGPLLLGGGIGYMKRLGGSVAFIADLSVLAGIAVMDNLDGSALNNGVSADVSLGLAVGF